MVGVVIDDAIVVLENVFRCIEEKGMDPVQASIQGTREIGPAVLATTISLVIVFLPVSFLSSVHGADAISVRHHGDGGDPGVDAGELHAHTHDVQQAADARPGQSEFARLAPRLVRVDGKAGLYVVAATFNALSLGRCFLLSIGTVATNFWLYDLVKQDYIPTNVDESEFEVSIQAPEEGASLASMDEALQRIEREIREIPGIELLLTTVGTRGFGGVNRAEFYVRLQDIETRVFSLGRWWGGAIKGDFDAAFRGNFTQRDKMAEVRKLFKQFPTCGRRLAQSDVAAARRAGRYRFFDYGAGHRGRWSDSVKNCASGG